MQIGGVLYMKKTPPTASPVSPEEMRDEFRDGVEDLAQDPQTSPK